MKFIEALEKLIELNNILVSDAIFLAEKLPHQDLNDDECFSWSRIYIRTKCTSFEGLMFSFRNLMLNTDAPFIENLTKEEIEVIQEKNIKLIALVTLPQKIWDTQL